MKKKNSLVLRKALTGFSVLLILFSPGVTAFASISDGAEMPVSEVAPEDTNSTIDQNESVQDPTTTPAPENDISTQPEQPSTTVSDKTSLTAQTAQLTEVLSNSDRYVSTTFDNNYLDSLLQRADSLLATETAAQSEIDDCTAEILQALAGLRYRGDKTALQARIDYIATLQASDYTATSFAALQASVKTANALLADIDAEQDALDQMLEAVNEALAALVKATPSQPEKPEQPQPEKPATPQPPKKPESSKPDQKPAESNSEAEEGTKAEAEETGTISEGHSNQANSEDSVVESNSGNDSVNPVDKEYAVDSLTDSDLNGYELPLLTSFEDERQAALVAQGLKTLSLPYEKEPQPAKTGELPTAFNNLSLPKYLYQSVLGKNLGETFEELRDSGTRRELTEAGIGDLLFWEKDGAIEQVAIYLGQGKYLMADEEALKEAQQVLPTKDIAVAESAADQEEIAGVRIYTVKGYQQDEDGKITIEEAAAENQKNETVQTIYDKQSNPSYAVHSIGDSQLTSVGQALIDNYAASVDFRVNPVTESFISSIAEDARQLGLEYDVYASVMIAQAILETGSGGSGLSKAPYYNLFGIKGLYNGNSVSMKTMEDDGTGKLFQITAAFRSYPNFRASLNDYVSLVRGGISGNDEFYKGTWRSEAKNYLQATEYLTGRYATDTTYNNKLNSIIAAYNLTQFDEPLPADNSVIIASRGGIPDYYREKMVYPEYNGVNYNLSGSYPVGQCTWYAYNRITQLGGKVDDYMGNGGEWGQRGAALGYQTTQIPTAGYAVSFHPGVAGSSAVYGHVAFVEAVGPDGILISEGNVLGGTIISYRVIPNSIARSNSVTYIAPK